MIPQDKPLKSPCISLCTLDEDDVCVGCFRTVNEITQWLRMDDEQRYVVLEKCRERARRNNPFA